MVGTFGVGPVHTLTDFLSQAHQHACTHIHTHTHAHTHTHTHADAHEHRRMYTVVSPTILSPL
jgi:mRNA degradation ribonuclease J1/J2